MNKTARSWLVFFLGLVAIIITVVLVFSFKTPERYLKVAFLDVGQGDAIYIEAPNGNQVLIDGGPDRGVLAELGDVMKFWDRSIDIIIGTHPDKDHIGGLIDVLQNYTVDLYLEPGIEPETQIAQRLQDLLHAHDIQMLSAQRGMRIKLDTSRGVFLDVLYPDHDVSYIADRNEGSVILLLVYGDTSFLLTGDAGVMVEADLIDEVSEHIDVEVLKLGHHGSRTSTSDEFLVATTPELAIISAGEGNRYGHPHQEVIERLNKFAIPYRATHEEGAIVLKSDGKHVWAVK